MFSHLPSGQFSAAAYNSALGGLCLLSEKV